MAEASRDTLKVRLCEGGREGWWMTVRGREEETKSFKKTRARRINIIQFHLFTARQDS